MPVVTGGAGFGHVAPLPAGSILAFWLPNSAVSRAFQLGQVQLFHLPDGADDALYHGGVIALRDRNLHHNVGALLYVSHV